MMETSYHSIISAFSVKKRHFYFNLYTIKYQQSSKVVQIKEIDILYLLH